MTAIQFYLGHVQDAIHNLGDCRRRAEAAKDHWTKAVDGEPSVLARLRAEVVRIAFDELPPLVPATRAMSWRRRREVTRHTTW